MKWATGGEIVILKDFLDAVSFRPSNGRTRKQLDWWCLKSSIEGDRSNKYIRYFIENLLFDFITNIVEKQIIIFKICYICDIIYVSRYKLKY